MEHSRRNSYYGMEHGKWWGELPPWNRTWNMADGTPIGNGTCNTVGGTLIVERNMEHGGWNSHSGKEHGTHTADGTLIVERNMEKGW